MNSPQHKDSHRPPLNRQIQQLLGLVCESIRDFRLYNSDLICVSIGRSRRTGRFGVWAHVSALPKAPQVGAPLYLMTFISPRFFHLKPRERLETIVHELYHLHPDFNGQLRRFKGSHRYHGPTPAAFNKRVVAYADEALSYLPSLLAHPLIQGTMEELQDIRAHRVSRKRYQVTLTPESNFSTDPVRPSTPPLKPAWGLGWLRGLWSVGLILCLLMVPKAIGAESNLRNAKAEDIPEGAENAASAEAPTEKIARPKKLKIKTKLSVAREGPLFQSPSSGSQQVGMLSADEEILQLKSSPSGQWVLVRSSNYQGWFPVARTKPWVALEDEEGVDGASSLQLTDAASALKKFDQKADQMILTSGGKFSDKPNKFASRYGLLEKGDQVKIMKYSPKGKWVNVQLLITGESGWVPTTWLRIEKIRRQTFVGPFSFEFSGAYGTQGINAGFGAAVTYNLFPGGFSGAPRTRVEVGLFAAWYKGTAFEVEGISALSRVNFYGSTLRYLLANEEGYLIGGIEVGLALAQNQLYATGLSADVLEAAGLQLSGNKFGGMLGALGTYAFTPNIHFGFGFRVFLVTNPPLSATTQLIIRF